MTTEPTGGKAIDWAAIHQRLEAATAAVELSLAPNAAQEQAVLDARAQALAYEAESGATPGEQLAIIAFVLAHERYGLEYRFVREVYPLREYTPLPGTPAFVLGLVNVRGRVVSVVDLKKLFDLPARGLGDLNKLILLETADQSMNFAVLADAMLEVRPVTASTLLPPPPTLTGLRAEFVRGVTEDGLIVLNAEQLLASPDILVQQEVEA